MPGILTRKGQVASVKPAITYPLTYKYLESAGSWSITPTTHEYQEFLTGWNTPPVTHEYQEFLTGWNTAPVVVEYQETLGWNLLAEPWWTASTFLLPFNTDFADVSPNAMGAMTENGTPTIDTVTKKFGAGSASFDGATDWLEVPDDVGLDLPGKFTLMAWLNLAVKSSQTLIEIGQFNSGGGMLVRLGAGGGAAEVYTASGWFTKNSLPAGQWVHFALTRDESGFMRMFYDGVNQGGATITDSIATTVGARIGRARHNGSDWLQGNIDDMLLVKDVCLFTDSFKPPDAELSSSFQFAQLPAYENVGGTGDRNALFTISYSLTSVYPNSSWFDGVYDNAYFNSEADVTGKHVTVDFGQNVFVDQWRWQNVGGLPTYTHGFWQPQVSDNGVDWTNAGAVQEWGGVPSYINFNHATPHRYMRILGVSGNLSQTFVRELEFRIAPGL